MEDHNQPADELEELEMLMKEAEEHATEIDYLERCLQREC